MQDYSNKGSSEDLLQSVVLDSHLFAILLSQTCHIFFQVYLKHEPRVYFRLIWLFDVTQFRASYLWMKN